MGAMEHATHNFKQKVFYSDTDAYGVVWHGSYLRWLEMGRIYFCEMFNHTLPELEAKNIVLPVAEINIKYRHSAKLNDEVVIKTNICDYSRCSITFKQTVEDVEEQKTYVEATVKVVAIQKDGTLYRSLPEEIKTMLR